MAKSYHVVHNSTGGWDVKRGGGQRASVHVDTKVEAENRARVLSKKNETELIIHGLNGKIQRCDSYGKDPCPPKDK